MSKINKLFTLYSLTAFLVIIERLSPTTNILIPPYNHIRLHEYIQTVIFLPVTIFLSLFILKEITNNFQTIKEKDNMILLSLFVVGIYLYGAGEGWHEVASFTLNTYCNPHQIIGNLCGGLFINDYYAGNIIFFIGGVLMNSSLLALSAKYPTKPWNKKDITIMFINSSVYAFTWFAYAAFDVVFVGLFFSALLMLISGLFYLKVRKSWRAYPYITYSTVAYALSTIATILVKFH